MEQGDWQPLLAPAAGSSAGPSRSQAVYLAAAAEESGSEESSDEEPTVFCSAEWCIVKVPCLFGGADDSESDEEAGWGGPNLAKAAFFKGLRVSAALLITSVGYAAVLGAFWAAYVDWLHPLRTAIAVVASYVCTNAAMFIYVSLRARCCGSEDTVEDEVWILSRLFAIATALAYVFGSLLFLVTWFWLRYDINIGGDLSAALDIVVQTRGHTAGETYERLLKRSGLAVALVVLPRFTTVGVMATAAIQAFDVSKWQEAEPWRRPQPWDWGIWALLNKDVLWLSCYLPAVLMISSISAAVTEGLAILLLLFLVYFMLSAYLIDWGGPSSDAWRLACCASAVMAPAGLAFWHFAIPPWMYIPAGVVVVKLPKNADVSDVIGSFMLAVLLAGGSAALKYDLIRLLEVWHVELPAVNIPASNTNFSVVLQKAPRLWPQHPSQLGNAEKAARQWFFVVLLIVETVLAFCLVFAILKLTPSSKSRVPGLSAEALSRNSVTASVLLLLLCLKCDLTLVAEGTEFHSGLQWEAWVNPYSLGLCWQIVQAATVPFTRAGTAWGFLSTLLAFLSGSAPWLSDAFDVAKDCQFTAMALGNGNVLVKAIGLVNMSYLVLYSLYSTVDPQLAAELPTSYLGLHAALIPPSSKPEENAQTPESKTCCSSCSCQSNCCSGCSDGGACRAALLEHWPKVEMVGYKQTRPPKVEGVVVEDAVQTGLSICYLGLTHNLQSPVPVLNVALPLARMAFAWKAHRPLLRRVQVRLVEEAALCFLMRSHDVAQELKREVLSGPPLSKAPKEDLQASLQKVFPEAFHWTTWEGGQDFLWLIPAWVAAHPQLTTLDLRNKSVGDAVAEALAAAIPSSQLTELDLGQNLIGDAGAQALAAAFPSSQLTYLNLGENSIGAAGAQALASAIPRSQLTVLGLGVNSLGCAGAQALAAAIPRSQLTVLGLGTNSLGDAGAQALAAAIPHSKLTELNLGNNSIGDDGAKALAIAIPPSQLTLLGLGSDPLEHSLSQALAAAIPRSRHPYSTNVGDAGALALAAAIPLSKLTYLHLQGNSIGYVGRKALREAKEAPGSSLRRLDL